MFNIKLDTWINICDMYFSLSQGTKKSYLQWFPFSKLSKDDENWIKSEEFYNKYIKTGTFVLYPGAMHRSENYIQKSDGSFRDATLISPILYLVLQCIGKNISDLYVSERPFNITTYYAGNFEKFHPKYKQDYDDFFKHLNGCIDSYQYFIKTDVTNFFNNINVNYLINRIDEVCNSERMNIGQTELLLYKELLCYCGAGRFPLIENSTASSYLATVVYMDVIDCKLYQFIEEKVTDISEFQIVRYVDDMYILFSTKDDESSPKEIYNTIINEYSSLLKQYYLSLNAKKCCIKKTFEINEELKKSLYDEIFNDQKCDIEEHFPGKVKLFLEEVCTRLETDGLANIEYMELVEEFFNKDSIEFSPSEVFNYFVYENDRELINEDVTKILVKIINCDLAFLSLDPKRLTAMIMKTGSSRAIRAMLNRLFERHRKGIWNSYDTTVAIIYLIQSHFKHIDLLGVIEKRCPELYEYYAYNCAYSFIRSLKNKKINRIMESVYEDKKALILHFLYLIEKDKGNILTAFAYFKTYFDRTTADLACRCGINVQKNGKPDYNAYYREAQLNKFYKGINGSAGIIEKAHRLRNASPLNHSSAELLDKNSSTNEIIQCIERLDELLYEYIRMNDL